MHCLSQARQKSWKQSMVGRLYVDETGSKRMEVETSKEATMMWLCGDEGSCS